MLFVQTVSAQITWSDNIQIVDEERKSSYGLNMWTMEQKYLFARNPVK